MFGLLRLLLILLVIQTIAYVALSFYSRGIRRRRLESWWDEKGNPILLDVRYDNFAFEVISTSKNFYETSVLNLNPIFSLRAINN